MPSIEVMHSTHRPGVGPRHEWMYMYVYFGPLAYMYIYIYDIHFVTSAADRFYHILISWQHQMEMEISMKYTVDHSSLASESASGDE